MKSMMTKLESERRQLPAYLVKQHIVNCVKTNSTLILIGETGSGKSTQIPQFLHEAGVLGKGMVAVTQPRRIAAVMLAKRVSHEKVKPLGELVGYSVRFENCTSEGTKIKFMTEGILLREAIQDKNLKKYNCIILDEAHERTINTDVLFGLVKKIQKNRRLAGVAELKVIIMSATMDVDHFSKYFNNCPVLYLPGRTFQVQLLHAKQRQEDYCFAAIATLFEIHKTAPLASDVLMFLTGKEEIDSMCNQIKNISKSQDMQNYPPMRVWPLHSALQPQQQFEAFQKIDKPTFRKIVVATNIAETSITLPGIKFVIDTGMVKIKRYDAATGLDSLKVGKISQAQAWQRAGRAGRESNGTCYRTYTAKEFDAFEKNTKPEILRCNLSAAILQLLAIGVNVETFDFIDKPPKEAVDVAFKQLKQLGAIKMFNSPQLTEVGRSMAAFPLDPTYSKIILSSPKYECVNEILDIIAMLSTENIYHDPGQNKRDQAIAQHHKLMNRNGDHITLLNIFIEFTKHSHSRQWCSDNCLNHKNLLYALDVRKQLAEVCDNLGISRENDSSLNNLDQIRKCLITGLFNNVAELQQRDNHYMVLASRQRAMIHPSSALSGYQANINGFSSTNGNGIVSSAGSKMKDGKAAYVVFSEIMQTSQIFLRTVTRIEPEWIEEVAPECGYLNRINQNQL